MKPPKPDPIPPIESVYGHAYDRYGLRLSLVFGNHAPGGRCPYFAANSCFHCQHGAGEGAAFTGEANVKRLRWFQVRYETIWAGLRHLVLHNSGSVLDPLQMPSAFLEELLAWASGLPQLKVLSLESREGHITRTRLEGLLDVTRDGIQLRPCLGLETADDDARNEVLEKHMPREAIERVFLEMRGLVQDYGSERFGLDVNLICGPPGVPAARAFEDVASSTRWVLGLARRYEVPCDLNMVPYYATERGWEAFPTHPSCSLETLVQCAVAAHTARKLTWADSNLFISWQDDGHAKDGALHERLAPIRDELQRYNNSQSEFELKRILERVRELSGGSR